MTRYVIGIYYVTHPNTVLLSRKIRPGHEIGNLNGIIGNVETGESPVEAMKREFKSETGVDVFGWKKFLEIERLNLFHVTFFYFKAERQDAENIQTYNNELLEWHSMTSLPKDVVPNLSWIIPLSLERDIDFPVIMRYR